MIYYIISFYILGFVILDLSIRLFNDNISAGMIGLFAEDNTTRGRLLIIALIIINWVSIALILSYIITYIIRHIQYTKIWVNINSFKIYECFCVNFNEEIKDELELDYKEYMQNKQILGDYRNYTILNIINRIKYTTVFGDKIKIKYPHFTIDKI